MLVESMLTSLLWTKLLAGSRPRLVALPQLVKDSFLQLPRPVLIGIRQGGAHRRAPHPQVLQFSFRRRQTAADLAQGLGPAQLAKQHGHELIPAGEAAAMTLGLMPLHQRFKLQSRKRPQQLRKNAAYSIQAEDLYFFRLVLTREPNPKYRSSAKSNLDRFGRELAPLVIAETPRRDRLPNRGRSAPVFRLSLRLWM